MALNQSALLELLKELELTDTTERIRLLTQRALQELINAEATAVIGAAPYERASDRTTQRNGTRPRTLTTTAGDLELKIPKLREGSFFPSLLERRRRVDQALFAVVMEAYVHGVSTRKVDDLVRALGADSGISKSEVSRICADLDEDGLADAWEDLGGTLLPGAAPTGWVAIVRPDRTVLTDGPLADAGRLVADALQRLGAGAGAATSATARLQTGRA